MIVLILYSVFLILATIIWLSAATPKVGEYDEKVTAIIVVRNEENSIRRLILSLREQTYKNLEILIVDDNSSDSTVKLIEESAPENLKLIHLKEEEKGASPKKSGIAKAISQAKGSIIFSTDGDCILPPKLIETYAGIFSDSRIKLISGPVTFISEKSIWNALQTVEFASLTGSAAVSIFMRKPIMSSAANLAYRKEAYLETGGFEDNNHLASGDDEFLMNQISRKYKNSVVYARKKACIVQTESSETLSDFYNQRKRWAGKWSSSSNLISQLTAVLIFVVNALTIYFMVTGNWDLLLFRFVTEFAFLASVLYFMNKKREILFIPLTQLIYPYYVVFFGIISLIPGHYIWKGRKLR